MSDHTEFTPGPWHVVGRVNVQSGPIGFLAYVSTAGARGRTIEEAEANARLIAAAPELLEALQALLHFTEELCEEIRVSKHYPSCEQARTVIKQALGKEQHDDVAS